MEYKQLYLCRKCQSWYGMNPEESLKGCPDCKAELEYVPVDYAAYTSMPETNQRAFWSKYLSEPRKGTDVCRELTERRSGIEAKTSADGTSERETDSEMNTRKTIGAIILLACWLTFQWFVGVGQVNQDFMQLVQETGIDQQLSTDAVIYEATRISTLLATISVGLSTLFMITIPLICRLVCRRRISYSIGNQICL